VQNISARTVFATKLKLYFFSKGKNFMRMRKKKNAQSRMSACAFLKIDNPEEFKGKWKDNIAKGKDVYLEIGCGKGNFAVGMAAQHHDVNFIAMEKIADVACLALEKAEKAKDERPDNLRFIIGDAKNLVEYFPEHSVDCIYLNFSDPWPKAGHAKRRLTYHTFLEIYKTLLKEGGLLRLKTDNEGLFDFSLEEFEAFGLKFEFVTRDLHHSEKNEGNVMTEYEKNFSDKGQPIYSAHVRF
jgi:tRNA (guanine-N7-)-methyltransferase